METSERVGNMLLQEAESEVRKMLQSLQPLSEGDLKGLEQQIMASVFRLGRRWMEQILTASGTEAKEPGERTGACGHVQHLVGYRPRQVLTLLGKISFKRAYDQCCLPADEHGHEQAEEAKEPNALACTHGEAPADARWGLHGQRTTAGVQQAISYLCATSTLEEAAKDFSRLLPLQMSARQALSLLQPVGEALQEQEQEQMQRLWEEASQSQSGSTPTPPRQQKSIERLYIELDGVMARLRRGSVPMQEQERKRKGDVYREIKVGAVFEASAGPERSQLAPGVFVDQAEKKHYVARRSKAEDFGKLLYSLAVAHGLAQAQQVVALGDGAAWIWRLVAEHFPEAVQIVDIYHAREHVWNIARAVFGPTSPAGRVWAEQACHLLEEGKIEELVEEIVVLPAIAPEPGASRSVPEIERDYFISHAARMRDPAFREQGMQIGSGIVEASCKTVVSTRTKRSGMRWTPAGLDAVLALRTAVLNGTYDAFCQQHSHLLA
jgi:hypothetical protein